MTVSPAVAQDADKIEKAEEEVSTLEEVDAQVDAILDKLMKPTGEPVADWNKGGVNIDQLLARDSSSQLMLVEAGDEPEPGIIILQSALEAAFASEWRLLGTTKINDGTATTFAIIPGTPTLAFAVGLDERKNGTADCGRAVEFRHYLKMGQSADEAEDLSLVTFMSRYFSKISKIDACSNYIEVRPGVYRARSFTSKGEPLGNVDAEVGDETIRPLSELSAILANAGASDGAE